jgi:hypothetical protein
MFGKLCSFVVSFCLLATLKSQPCGFKDIIFVLKKRSQVFVQCLCLAAQLQNCWFAKVVSCKQNRKYVGLVNFVENQQFSTQVAA